jgi:hypothetical protein
VATLASMTVRLGIDTDALREGADRAKGILGGLGKAVAGLGVGVPAAAAVAAGVGGMAAAFASAGVAAKAFQLAVGPQMADVAEAAGLAEEAEKAAAAGAEDAAEKQKAYTDALAAMPPHTRAMAKEFVGLKKDYNQWSDSLSSTTMPVFTKGLQVVRRLLPLLTPFVKAAATAFGEFVDEIDRSTKGKGLQAFADSMAKVAGQNLKSLLFGLKNIAVGIGGVIKAFLPLSTTMSGGFEESTAAFAKWGQGLSNSEGFAQFIDLARQGAQTLGTLATTVLKLAVALAPLIGVTATIALHLANIINALPPAAVQALAYSILAAVVAFKTFRAASSAVDTASDLMNSRLGQVARRWVTTAATSIKSGARIAASATVTAARTAGAWAAAAARATVTWLATMIRVAAVTVARFAMMAARAVIWAATMAAQWLIAMGPIGWIIAAVIALVALIIIYWDEIKAATLKVWSWITEFLRGFVTGALSILQGLAAIPGKIADWFGQAKDWAIRKLVEMTLWVAGLPGRIGKALSGLLGVVRQRAASAFQAFRNAAVQRAIALVTWVQGLPGRISRGIGSLAGLLVGKGRDVVTGLWNGIQSMGGWIRSKLIGWAKAMVPGPIAKALGISSPSKVTAAQGRWIARGLIDGLTGSSKQVRAASYKLVDIVRDSLTGARRTKALKAINKNAGWLDWLAQRDSKVTAQLKTANKRLADLIKARAKLAEDVRKGILDAANITQFTAGTGDSASTAGAILSGLQDKLAMAKKFAADLAALRKKGVRSDLIAQIAQAGVEQGSAAAAALASADKGMISQINSTQGQLVKAAGQAGSVASNAMYGAGVHAAQGIVEGLKARQKTIEQTMLKIAQGMSKAIKKALGIKSPSTLMADQVGRWIPLGIAEGAEAAAPALDKAMRGLVDVPGLGAVNRGRRTQLATQATGLRIELAGPADMKRLIRRIVQTNGRGGDTDDTFGTK